MSTVRLTRAVLERFIKLQQHGKTTHVGKTLSQMAKDIVPYNENFSLYTGAIVPTTPLPGKFIKAGRTYRLVLFGWGGGYRNVNTLPPDGYTEWHFPSAVVPPYHYPSFLNRFVEREIAIVDFDGEPRLFAQLIGALHV